MTTGACTAVGSYLAPAPPCSAANRCGGGVAGDAVPAAGGALGRVALVERWTGGTWAVQAVPPPSDRDYGLTSVDCPGIASCVAVGFDGPATTSGVGFNARWDGSAWTAQLAAPGPPGDPGYFLFGVACPGLEYCLAVGSSDLHARAELWTGTSWKLSPPGDGPRNKPANLYGVACPAVGLCFAVGVVMTIEGESPVHGRPLAKVYVARSAPGSPAHSSE